MIDEIKPDADQLSEDVLPVIPLRDVVVFPHMVVPLFVGRQHSVRALELASVKSERRIFVVTQRDPAPEEPEPHQLYEMGCVANILQLLKLPDGTVKVLVEGKERAKSLSYFMDDGVLCARYQMLNTQLGTTSEITALRRLLLTQFAAFVKLHKQIPNELLASIGGIEDHARMVDAVATHLPIKIDIKQKVLDAASLRERFECLLTQLEAEIDILQVEKRIRGRVKRQMDKNQREYYLNEQVKAIQKELGEGEDGPDLAELEKKIQSAGMSEEGVDKALSELRKLRMMAPMSAEATVVRTYIDTLLDLPWKKKTRVGKNLVKAEKTLDADHYGLEKVKERIVEYLAVQHRVEKVKAPILCLVGPPGVGKTSLGQSIARATNRKFVRMALGGVRDEAEIRGHRRTYIGSMPGKIIQSLSKATVRNPLFLLDEVDKLGQDFRGDPSSALLEVLDPEQNNTFQDHYIDVDFDLSDVMFVATANSLNIPPPLLDRMEVIRLSGYTEDEKINIGSRYLLPKQIKNTGLREGELSVDESALRDIVRYYTREAGVRALEREISKICRKVVKKLVMAENSPAQSEEKSEEALTSSHSARQAMAQRLLRDPTKEVASDGASADAQEMPTTGKKRKRRGEEKTTFVTSENLSEYLGVRRYSYGMAEKENQVGQVTGLAWTEVGGELLTIECATMPGKGQILRTGSLGAVMKESAEAARSVVRARAARLGIKSAVFEKTDIHLHVPEGATPKDGPSAGIAMTTALVSAFTAIPVRCDVCMTGEITLRGEVLPIGGLKEKLLAAVRGGVKTALIPEENAKDLAEISDNIKNRIEIIPVKWIDDVLKHALQSLPQPLEAEEKTVASPGTPLFAALGKEKSDGDIVTH